MQLSDHSLRQLDAAALQRLQEEALRTLSVKLLEDLKEARERLNQNSQNSSRPPSSEPRWESPSRRPKAKATDEAQAKEEAQTEEAPASPPPEAPGPDSDAVPPKRKAGKAPGSPGYGCRVPEWIDVREVHGPSACACCGKPLSGQPAKLYTAHYEFDFERTPPGGWRVVVRLHQWQESTCVCGHATRATPWRGVEEGVALGGCRRIGPGLASLIVALNLRYRLSRARIREFLGDWLGIRVSVGAIHAAIEEASLVVAPVEAELIDAVQQSGLLYADETPLPEQGARGESLWLWVFLSAQVTLYFVSHRGQELVKNLLENYTGVLMSDGWQAYRWLKHRLRCWAHLKRKAVGLTESLDAQAQAYGQSVLALWRALRQAIRQACDGPPEPIRDVFQEPLDVFRRQCETMQHSSHAKTRQLAVEFLNDWEAIFAVLGDPRWPLTNNHAERALRHSRSLSYFASRRLWGISRQLSHGTRTARRSRGLALLASVIDTCRQRGHSPWDYLQTAITLRRQNRPLLPLPV